MQRIVSSNLVSEQCEEILNLLKHDVITNLSVSLRECGLLKVKPGKVDIGMGRNLFKVKLK